MEDETDGRLGDSVDDSVEDSVEMGHNPSEASVAEGHFFQNDGT